MATTANPSPVPAGVTDRIVSRWPCGMPWLHGYNNAASLASYLKAAADALVSGADVFEVPAGLAVWRMLRWDSEMLGMSTARIDAIVPENARRTTPLVRALVGELRAHAVEYATARVPAADWGLSIALSRAGFVPIDAILTFVKRAIESTPPALPVIRAAQPDDADQVGRIARDALRVGRFYADPAIPRDAAGRVFEQWARNSVIGGLADITLIVEDRGEILGLITGRVDALTVRPLGWPVLVIGLVATAARARGMGLGKALVHAMVSHAARHDCRAVEVGTSLDNYAAVRMYESAGFRLASSSLTFRFRAARSLRLTPVASLG